MRKMLVCLFGAGLPASCAAEPPAGPPDQGGGQVSNAEPVRPATPQDDEGDDDEDTLQFGEAKILVEHNASAEDTGFQGFVDGEPWNRLDITAPDGASILSVRSVGRLRALGLTELFFETQEPANAEVPIEELLARMPEGTYEFEGRSIDGQDVEGEATLTHTIPAGPEIVSPAEGAVIDAGTAVIDWNAVTETVTGSPDLELAGYELIIEEDVEDTPLPGFAKVNLDIHVPPDVTSLTVPPEFLRPGTAYKFEVLALEAGGNQTITEGTFETAE